MNKFKKLLAIGLLIPILGACGVNEIKHSTIKVSDQVKKNSKSTESSSSTTRDVAQHRDAVVPDLKNNATIKEDGTIETKVTKPDGTKETVDVQKGSAYNDAEGNFHYKDANGEEHVIKK